MRRTLYYTHFTIEMREKTMAFYRKKKSGWQFRISYKTADGKYKEISKSCFKTKAEAVNAAAIAQKELSEGVQEDKNITLADYFKEWMEIYKKPDVDPETYSKYKFTHKVIKEYFKNAKLSKITATQYQKVFNNLSERYVKETVKRINSNIRQAIKVAIHEGSLKKDFTALVKIHSSVESKKEENKYLELDQRAEFIESVSKTIQYQSSFFCYVVAKTGLRFSEAQGLTNDDNCINRKELYIYVFRTYKINGARRGWGKTKNPQSVRKVPINQDFLDMLDKYLATGFVENDDNRLFTRVSNNMANKLIKKRTQTEVTCHGLRHTYVSFLIYHNVDVVSIAKLVGHKDATETLQTYAHLFEKKQDEVFDFVRGIA